MTDPRMSPLLSVIIVVFNRREALARTLAEVMAALERLAASLGGKARSGTPGGMATPRRGHGDESEIAKETCGDDEQPTSPPDAQTGGGPARVSPPASIATAAPAQEPDEFLTLDSAASVISEGLLEPDDDVTQPSGRSDGSGVVELDPPWLGLAEIIVVDNASTDGSTDTLEDRFPHCRVLRLAKNTGVAAFNRGVEAASGTYVLILDDDVWPAGPAAIPTPHPGPLPVQSHGERGARADALSEAVAFLERQSSVAAVMLQPVHPRTGALEWPFDRVKDLTRNWPDLRCANLIRREAWNAVGGYEEGFFLYRNDTDLALKLLGSGHDIAYNPAWRAMHDSPHIAVRRVRWFYLSTRNWCWMCRRHARGLRAWRPALMGWLWAHRLAGPSPARQWAAFRGGLAGWLAPPPKPPACVRRDGVALSRLIALKRSLRRSREARERPARSLAARRWREDRSAGHR